VKGSKRDYKSERADGERLTLNAWDEERGIGVKLEDDDCAAFAYLWDGTEVLSAVWLYNHQHADGGFPRTAGGLPTANPFRFIIEPQILPIHDEHDVQVTFRGALPTEYRALVYIRRRPHACLSAVEKIGWCVSARPGGPYAKSMTVHEQNDGTFAVKLGVKAKAAVA
jgi:hypothetical protein